MMKKPQKYAMPCKGCVDKIPEQRTHGPWWLPGIVVVEFKQHVEPGSITQLGDAKSRKDLSWLDIEGLQHVIRDRMVKPPKWTFSFDPHKPPTESHYRRFVTFYLDANANVPEVSKSLSAIRGVVRAAGEPKLSPPLRRFNIEEPAPDLVPMLPSAPTLSGQPQTPLLMEPLAVSGGQALGVSVVTGTQDLKNQWYLFRCKADQLIRDGITGAGVVVAAVDWGVNVDHQELANRIAFSYNASKDNADVSSGPFRFHGTATLGLIGAGDNDAGMLGFASGAELWAIQGQDEGDNIDNSCWARAIEEARTQSSNGKRKVILVEASTDSGFNIESSPSVSAAIRTAINDDNCVVCVAAGDAGVNAGLKEDNQPIPDTGSILVGATKYKLDPTVIERAQSNWGNRVVVSAPGASATDVTSCDCGNDTYTNRFGGTSGAAAKVAGAMALLLEKFPDLTHQQIVDVLRDMPQIPAIQGKTIGTFLDLSTIVANVSLLPGM